MANSELVPRKSQRQMKMNQKQLPHVIDRTKALRKKLDEGDRPHITIKDKTGGYVAEVSAIYYELVKDNLPVFIKNSKHMKLSSIDTEVDQSMATQSIALRILYEKLNDAPCCTINLYSTPNQWYCSWKIYEGRTRQVPQTHWVYAQR